MPKVIINPIQNLDNPPTAVAGINKNFLALQLAIEKTLSRDGTVPNAMQSNLDMNANRILNLPVPVSATEPARHGDIQQYVDQAQDWAIYAENQADRAEAEADDAEQSADEAQASLVDLQTRYVGAYAAAPSLDPFGNALLVGALYYNTSVNQLNVFALDDVHSNGEVVYAGVSPVVVGYWIPVPIENYDGLNDVDMTGLITGQIALFDGLLWRPADLSAENVSFIPDALASTDVQGAIDELVDRTSLAVYDIAFWASGLMENSELLFRMVASRTFTVPVGGTGSIANNRVAANNVTVLSLRKNGAQFGTVTYAAAGTTGVFSVPGATVFNSGDILSITAPATADTALRDTSITLACRR